jgi:hypothetical protein
MQGFRTSAPKSFPPTQRTLDATYLPSLDDPSIADPYAYIRVPLLPDNASPPAGARLPEQTDAPLPRPEILVVAANPEQVLPVALTEVEGMGVDGVELGFVHLLGDEGIVEEGEQGMLKDIWKGLMDDVFGAGQVKKVVA